MAKSKLILDRYQPLGKAGSGGYGTVQVAWDPRIQRKVAIKTIELSATDALRAVLPGAEAGAAEEPRNGSLRARLSRMRETAWAPQEGRAATEGDAALPAMPAAAPLDSAEYLLPWEDGVSPWRAGNAVGNAAGDATVTAADAAAATAAADAAATAAPVSPTNPSATQFHSMAKVPGLDEARTAAMLQDPRIVTVYDVEIRNQTAYLIMEYVEGITLTKLLHEFDEFLTLDVVAAVFDGIAGALETAHKAGVLHLDIKPDNVLIDAKGQVKVTDFGLATLADASGRGTTGGGTIGYMPLEQMRREPLDARTDEWSLASVAYEMLTGQNPFFAPGLSEAQAAIEEAELVLPSLCWDNLDAEADDVVFYALDPDRDERYASVKDFREELDKFLGDAERGKDDLRIIVEESLGIGPSDEELEAEDAGDGTAEPANAGAGQEAAPARTRRDRHAADEGANDSDQGRSPLRERLGARGLAVAAHVFAAIASALVAYAAAAYLPPLPGFADAGIATALVAAVAAAVLGAIRPHLGALTAFALWGVALVVLGSPVLGVILILATVTWWWFAARSSSADANTALALPLVGAVGASAFIPLEAGVVLRPKNALATVAYAALVSLVLGALGTGNLLGWDALRYLNQGAAGITDRAVLMVTSPATWILVAAWVVSAAIQALLCQRRGRVVSVLGVILGAVLMAAGSFALSWFESGQTALAPQWNLLIPIIISAVVMMIVVIWVRPADPTK